MRNGRGRKRKILISGKGINPAKKARESKKLDNPFDHYLALEKLRTLPGLTFSKVGASQMEEDNPPQLEESEQVESSVRFDWGDNISSQVLADDYGGDCYDAEQSIY